MDCLDLIHVTLPNHQKDVSSSMGGVFFILHSTASAGRPCHAAVTHVPTGQSSNAARTGRAQLTKELK